MARPHLLATHCGVDLSGCPKSQILPLDQPGLGIENGPADGYSFFSQNFSGALAVTLPAVYQGAQIALGAATPAAAAAAFGADLVLFLETWGTNGALTEAVRLVVQRPRPYVYAHPEQGMDPQNYVSFYSGHTSFTAAACLFLLLILFRRGASTRWLLPVAAIAQCLIISTAVFRILSGRHFLTDVLAGAVMGGAVALFVAYHHPGSRSQDPLGP